MDKDKATTTQSSRVLVACRECGNTYQVLRHELAGPYGALCCGRPLELVAGNHANIDKEQL